ncbi:MAG TPA: hypothetical protein VFK06_10810 [Candidatus Angelobacter sp.]|nr:hypothetical protein [Candidatus Angelobacter sp.]
MAQDSPTHIDAAISDLESWMERISASIETLKYFRSQGGASLLNMPAFTGMRPSSAGEIPDAIFFEMSVPDAAEKYLGMVKKEKTTNEIADALLRGGLKSAAKNFPSMVNTILSRDSRFVKINGQWGLNAWYPAMRRAQRSSTAPETTVNKQSKEDNGHGEIGPDSLKGMIISTLNSSPGDTFDAARLSDMFQKHLPSIRAALCKLYEDGLIAKPASGQYQALKKHPS